MLNWHSFPLAVSIAGLLALTACSSGPNSGNEMSSGSNPTTSTSDTSASGPDNHNGHSTDTAKGAQPLSGEAKDVDYVTKLGLMRGHLLVAQELLDQQKLDQAEPHIGHPVEEIYSDVESQLSERNVKDFKTTLTTLHDTVKASNPNPGKLQTNFAAAEQAVDTAMQAVPATERQSPALVLQVINGLLDTADGEYSAAIANDKVVEVIEYQDSRGFVLEAQNLYKGISDQMAKQAPEAHQAIAKNLDQLATAWPAVTPPTKPVLAPTQVSQLVQAIEQETEKVVK